MIVLLTTVRLPDTTVLMDDASELQSQPRSQPYAVVPPQLLLMLLALV